MTIEEVNDLAFKDRSQTLRRPKNMITTNEQKLKELYEMFYWIAYSLDKEHSLRTGRFIVNAQTEFYVQKLLKRNPLLQDITEGDGENPTCLHTEYGDIQFTNADNYFKNHKYPPFLAKNYCYENNFFLSASYFSEKEKARQLTGISYIGKPFLHSVVYFEDGGHGLIMDFNLDLVMDAKMYLKLTSFETLAENDGQYISNKMHDLFKAKRDFKFKCPEIYLAFCFDEVYLKLKEAVLRGEDRFVIENGIKKNL